MGKKTGGCLVGCRAGAHGKRLQYWRGSLCARVVGRKPPKLKVR
jgi:hypothetical protein